MRVAVAVTSGWHIGAVIALRKTNCVLVQTARLAETRARLDIVACRAVAPARAAVWCQARRAASEASIGNAEVVTRS